MNTKIMRNVFDRHIRPTRELDRFLFKLSTVLSLCRIVIWPWGLPL